ncbi:protein ENL isoform X2 [Pangasianodon hypophthalmus]|uniref:protein ENL isoform X2 n=1 Tax=Pangasianodon hypophthalmus TaxID=310915 RepID=UPI002306E92A|nr:protein ENL isoform X2 [Pangasianodon hypophthalmus]
MEEHKKVCFNCDLFLNQESNPPVSHLRYEKLTFNNKKHKFHHKVVKTGGVMVVPEGTEMMPRAGVDYSMLSTTALSAVSDHKKIKSHQAMKEPNKDRAGGVGKGHKHYKPNREHREHKNSESKTTSREREHVGGKSTLELSSSSSSRKSTENRGKDEGKNMAKVAFKEPKNTTRESKRPSSTTKSSNLSTKKLKSLKGCKEGGSITISSRISSTSAAPPSTYLEKKGTKEKGHWVKRRHETLVVKRRTDSDCNSEDETLSRSVSVQSTSSSSCSTSGSDSEFEPLQMQSQGPLHAMVEHLPSERSDDDRSSEVETGMKATPTVQDSCLFMDSDSDDVEESHPHSQEVLSPIPKLSTKNLKMLEKKNPDSCKREKVLKGDKAYTEELVDLHRRLMALRERNVLQQIVNLIEKTGHFNVTKTTFDFDLFSLDESTVRKLQSYLQAKRT